MVGACVWLVHRFVIDVMYTRIYDLVVEKHTWRSSNGKLIYLFTEVVKQFDLWFQLENPIDCTYR